MNLEQILTIEEVKNILAVADIKVEECDITEDYVKFRHRGSWTATRYGLGNRNMKRVIEIIRSISYEDAYNKGRDHGYELGQEAQLPTNKGVSEAEKRIEHVLELIDIDYKRDSIHATPVNSFTLRQLLDRYKAALNPQPGDKEEEATS